MDQDARRHADDLTRDIMEAVELGFRDDDLQAQVSCLSLRAFARAFPKTQQHDDQAAPRPAQESAAAAPLAALPSEKADEETPIG